MQYGKAKDLIKELEWALVTAEGVMVEDVAATIFPIIDELKTIISPGMKYLDTSKAAAMLKPDEFPMTMDAKRRSEIWHACALPQ